MSQFKQIKEMAAVGESVKIYDIDFKIYKLSLKQIAKIFKSIQVASTEIGDAEGEGDLIDLMVSNLSIGSELVSYATKTPLEEVKEFLESEDLPADVFINLVLSAVEVNKKVFLEAMERLKKAAPGLNLQAIFSGSQASPQKAAPVGAR